MYGSKLSWKQLVRYLNPLLERGLIKVRMEDKGKTKVYHASQKGSEYLALVERLQSFVDIKSVRIEPGTIEGVPLSG